MRHRQSAVGVAVLALAVTITVAATPVGGVNAASSLDLGAQHSTDSDFNSAQTLTNMSVGGGTVSLSSSPTGTYTFSDGFESDTAGNAPDDWTVAGGSPEVTNTRAANGSKSVELDASNGDTISHTVSTTTKNLTYRLYVPSNREVSTRLEESGTRVTDLRFDGDITTGSGTTVTTTTDTDKWVNITLFNFDTGADQYDIYWECKDGSCQGDEHDLALNNPMSSGYDDIRYVGIGNNVNFVDQVELGEETTETDESGQYIGSNLSVDDATELAINRTLENATMNATLEAHSGGSWGEVATLDDTNSSTTNTTVPVSGGGANSTYRLDLNFSREDGDTSAELHDYTLLFDSTSPTVAEPDATPRNDTRISQRDVTLSLPVNDSDFGGNGDTLAVDYYLNGTKINTSTVQQNGTANHTTTVATGGPREWSAVVRSTQYDEAPTATSNFTFQSPGELLIRNESNPSESVDEAQVELQFFFDGSSKIASRNTSDGSINMTGLPADESFIVVADDENASDKYHPRRVFIESLYEQQRVYLLPKNVPFVDTTFKLEDLSGDFPDADTVLLVERPINDTFRAILGDRFGATGQFPAQLAFNTRHRLVVLNTETGERLTRGSFTPTSSGEQTVTITSGGDIDLRRAGPDIVVKPQPRRVPATTTGLVSATVRENTETVSSWNVVVVYRNETVARRLDSASFSDPDTYGPALNLGGLAGGNVTVAVTVQLANGDTVTDNTTLPVAQHFGNQYSLVGGLNAIPGRLGSGAGAFQTFVGIAVAIFTTGLVASKTAASSEVAGGVGWLSMAGFAVVGWLSAPLLFATGVMWAGGTALRRGL